MAENNEKIVDFTYCSTCIHKEKNLETEPCNDCVYHPVNQNSKRPVHYKEK